LVTEGLVKGQALHAGRLVGQLARHIKGGGGGQPFFATAGGKDASGIPEALKAARALADSKFS
jgi:alanyl-tRNA synthetase